MPKRRIVSWAALGLAAVAGCDSVAGDGYQGEALARIQGLVIDEMTGPPGAVPPLDVALVWGVWMEGDGPTTGVLAEKVPIVGSFPADFELTLRNPPPAGAAVRFGDITLSYGFVAAIAKDTWAPGTRIQAGRTVAAYGNAKEAVMHLDRDVTDEAAAVLLGGVRTAGFHLVEHVFPHQMTDQEKRQRMDACRTLAPAGQAAMCDDLLQPDAAVPRLLPADLQHRIRMEVDWEPALLGGSPDPDPNPDPGAGGLVGGGS